MRWAWILIVVLSVSCSNGSGGAGTSPADTSPDVAADVAVDVAPDLAMDASPAPDAADAVEDIGPPAPVEHGGVTAAQVDDALVLSNGQVEVRYGLEAGTWDIFGPGGETVLLAAEARVVMDDGTFEGVPLGTSGFEALVWEAEAVDDMLGAGVLARITVPTEGPTFTVEMSLRGAQTYLLVQSHAAWPAEGAGELRVRDAVPLVADGRTGGALFVGAEPFEHMVLDNGADAYFDFAARVFRVGQGGSVFFPPGSVSNWNMALVDSQSDRSLVAGYLSFDKAIGLLRLHHESAVAMELDGRTSFTRFEAFGRLEPAVPPPSDSALFAPGTRTLSSEVFYLDVAPATPFDGLEDWAARYAAWHDKTLWTDIPTGWNSWGGGGGSGGLGAHIDEPLMLENLDAMIADLVPFGMDWFMLDDGWQVDHGDWDTHPDFFPPHDGQDGLHWLADHIYEQGATPGIWIAPFVVHKETAQVAAEHPEWLAPVSELGHAIVADYEGILDLSNPEVLEWIHALFTKITQEWGYRWIKMDFAYLALFPETLHNPEKTASEAFHDALAVIRDAIGPDTFFLTISAMGICMDSADGSRTTLDNEPDWGNPEQGIKVTQRTAAHRYYLSNLWVNHPDLVFYRPNPYGMTLGEARTWTSQVALLGGIVKLGETYTAMSEHPEWLDLLRPIIPVYPHSARPLDLFELLHPEVWVLPVTREARIWHVAGLYNWGVNENLVTSEELPDAPRVKTLEWASMGYAPDQELLLFDAWEHTCEWAEGPSWSVEIPQRSDRILVVRPVPEEPEVVHTSRHLMGGALEVSDEVFVEGEVAALGFQLSSPAGYEVTVYIAGAGMDAKEIMMPLDATLQPGPCDGIWAVTFTPSEDVTSVQVQF